MQKLKTEKLGGEQLHFYKKAGRVYAVSVVDGHQIVWGQARTKKAAYNDARRNYRTGDIYE